MELFNSLLLQLKKYWNSANVVGRAMSVGAVAILALMVVVVAVWSSTPDYKLLREGISPVLTAEIKSVLDSSGIPNQMNYSGTGVMVPTSRWNEANIAISSLGIPSESNSASSTGGMFPRAPEHRDILQSKEIALERGIESLQAVKSADVHLAVPERSPFRSARQPASASVIVESNPGHVISRELSMNIVLMVASAVEGLDPKNVNLTNADGSVIGKLASDDPAENRREFVRNIEAELAMKAQELLSPVLGPGQSRIRVNADIDNFFDRVVTTEKIDVDGKARINEKLISSDQQGLPLAPRGVAGTGSNDTSSTTASLNGQQVQGKMEETETTYEYPRTKEQLREVGGQIKRLSVSATVDVTPNTGGDSTAAPDSVQAILTKEQVEALVMRAVGFDKNRGDEIEIALVEFSHAADTGLVTTVPDSQKWEFVTQLARNSSLGLAAVVALLIGTMTLKKLQPITIKSTEQDRRRRDLLSQLTTRVDENPEAVSRILAAWLDKRSESDAEAKTVPMSKAA